MNLNEQFPYLSHFFGAYFHQDWMMEYANEEMAVKGYVDDDGSEDANRVIKELDQFLSLNMSEADLRKAVLDELGSDYFPESTYPSIRDWLLWIRSMLAKYSQ